MLLSSLFTLSLITISTTLAAPTSSCTADVRRKGLRQLIRAFIHGLDGPNSVDFATIPLADNVTSIIQTQGIRIILGHDLDGARRAIKLVNTITTDFGPAAEDIKSYLDNGYDMSYVNGTADVGLLGLKLFTAPATQNMQFDLNTCKAYEAVGTVEPVNGLLQTTLETLMLQNIEASAVVERLVPGS